jgi:hypothetical protein
MAASSRAILIRGYGTAGRLNTAICQPFAIVQRQGLHMILIGVGSNVPGPWGTPEETVARVGFELGRGPVRVERVSRPVRTTPFGVTEQPPFTNAALAIETDLPPRLGCFIFRRWSGGLAATGLRLRDDGVALALVLKRHSGGQIGHGRARAPVRYRESLPRSRRSLASSLAGFAGPFEIGNLLSLERS